MARIGIYLQPPGVDELPVYFALTVRPLMMIDLAIPVFVRVTQIGIDTAHGARVLVWAQIPSSREDDWRIWIKSRPDLWPPT